MISAEEDTYWAITRSKRYRLKLGVGVGVGLQAATVGLPLPLGIPMQTAQLTTTRETAFLVVRSEEADGARAVAFDTRDGRMKWTRKLGVTSPVSPIVLGTTAIVIDEDGGVVVLNESDAKGTEATPIARGQLLAQPVTRPAAPALPCVTPDGKTVWVLAPERGDKESLSMRIRKVADGKASLDVLVALQPNAKPVSPAIVVGNGVVFAAADGNLYRYEVGNPKLIQGPTWRGDGVPPTEPCWLVPYSATEFLMTDGGKTVSRFRWPEEKDFKLVAGPWALRDRIAFSPLALPNDKRIVLADGLGNVLLYDADAVGEPLRRWRSNDTIPAGTPTMVLSAMGNKDSLVLVIAIDGKHLVGVTPDSDDALWVVKRPNGVEFLGGTVVGDVVVMTDQAGTLTSYEAATGGKLGSVRPENAELLPRSHAVPFTAKLMALPALDGSVVFLRFIGK